MLPALIVLALCAPQSERIQIEYLTVLDTARVSRRSGHLLFDRVTRWVVGGAEGATVLDTDVLVYAVALDAGAASVQPLVELVGPAADGASARFARTNQVGQVGGVESQVASVVLLSSRDSDVVVVLRESDDTDAPLAASVLPDLAGVTVSEPLALRDDDDQLLGVARLARTGSSPTVALVARIDWVSGVVSESTWPSMADTEIKDWALRLGSADAVPLEQRSLECLLIDGDGRLLLINVQRDGARVTRSILAAKPRSRKRSAPRFTGILGVREGRFFATDIGRRGVWEFASGSSGAAGPITEFDADDSRPAMMSHGGVGLRSFALLALGGRTGVLTVDAVERGGLVNVSFVARTTRGSRREELGGLLMPPGHAQALVLQEGSGTAEATLVFAMNTSFMALRRPLPSSLVSTECLLGRNGEWEHVMGDVPMPPRQLSRLHITRAGSGAVERNR